MNTKRIKAEDFLVLAVLAVLCIFTLTDRTTRSITDTVSPTDTNLVSSSDIEITDAGQPALSGELADAITQSTAAVIDGAEMTLTAIAEAAKNKNNGSKYYIVVYKGSQSTVVYRRDSNGDYTRQVKVFTCSTGAKSSPTRTGKYKIRAKYRWRSLVGGVYGQYSSSISNSYLFHSVPYYKQNPSTLENEEYDRLGSPASKGCIRMCVRDCKWIYDNCPIGTEVNIVDGSGPKGPGVPQRSKREEYGGWDPSDKWSAGNPYFNQTISSVQQHESTMSASDKQ